MSRMTIFGDRQLEELTDAELRAAGPQVCHALRSAAGVPAGVAAAFADDLDEVFANIAKRWVD